jgi:hypothetical protein
MSSTRPNWFDLLPKVELAITEEARISNIRFSAGWEHDEYGWWGRHPETGEPIHHSLWEEETGLPFPEEA